MYNTEWIADAAIEYIESNPGSLFAKQLEMANQHNDLEGMFEILKNAELHDMAMEVQNDEFPDTY